MQARWSGGDSEGNQVISGDMVNLDCPRRLYLAQILVPGFWSMMEIVPYIDVKNFHFNLNLMCRARSTDVFWARCVYFDQTTREKDQ